MPIRPAPRVSWVHEAEGSDVSPPGVLRHACVLIGGTTTLYTRQLPGTLRPPLCRLQELPLYAGADSFGEVADDTQLVVFKSCAVSDVWRDRDIIRRQLDQYHVLFLCNDPRADDGQSARLARHLGMDQSAVRPFYLVTKRDMEDAAAKGDEAVVVEASDTLKEWLCSPATSQLPGVVSPDGSRLRAAIHDHVRLDAQGEHDREDGHTTHDGVEEASAALVVHVHLEQERDEKEGNQVELRDDVHKVQPRVCIRHD